MIFLIYTIRLSLRFNINVIRYNKYQYFNSETGNASPK